MKELTLETIKDSDECMSLIYHKFKSFEENDSMSISEPAYWVTTDSDDVVIRVEYGSIPSLIVTCNIEDMGKRTNIKCKFNRDSMGTAMMYVLMSGLNIAAIVMAYTCVKSGLDWNCVLPSVFYMSMTVSSFLYSNMVARHSEKAIINRLKEILEA